MKKSPGDSEVSKLHYEDIPPEKIVPPAGCDQFRIEAFEAPLLLLPPIVNKIPDDRYRIVDGLRRFYAAKAAGDETVRCGVIAPEASPAREAYLRLSLNPGRVWNSREKIAVIDSIVSSEAPMNREVLARSGISQADVKSVQFLRSAPSDVLEAVTSERIHLGVVREFCILSAEDRAAFLESTDGLSASLQMQREMLEWSSEIASARSTSVADVLNAPEIHKIAKDSIQNAPQRLRRLRGTLFALRFPRFEAARKHWDAEARRISKIGGISLSPDSAFEKDRLEVKIVFGKADRPHTVFKELSSIPEQTWELLISPFRSTSGGMNDKT